MISVSQLRFRYPRSEFELRIDELSIDDTQRVAIVGPSGCGKTTLLNLLAGIALPESGQLEIAGQSLWQLPDHARRDFRISQIGMVFQQFELVEYLDLKHNILLPFLINRSLELTEAVQQRAEALAVEMGLGDKLKRLPNQLSQGEKQRCAVCRALVTEPRILLADEPTGNLDPANKHALMELVFEQTRKFSQTLIVVTHDMSLLEGMDRTVDFEQFRVATAPAGGA